MSFCFRTKPASQLRSESKFSAHDSSEKRHEELITSAAPPPPPRPYTPLPSELDSHLSLDVVLQQVLVHRVQLSAAHVVVVVRDGVAKLLAVGAVLPVVGLVGVVVVVVTFQNGEPR